MPELIESEEISEVSFSKQKEDKSRHYVDDEELTRVLTDWVNARKLALLNGEETPVLPNYAAVAIMDMADALGKRFNFSGYSYLDEMKSDAILHCIQYIHNFNPSVLSEKKKKVSAFGYINMILWRSFGNRIKEEHHEQYLKYVSFRLMGGHDAFAGEDMSDGGEDDVQVPIGELGDDFISKAAEYEEKYLNKVKKDRKGIQFDDFLFSLGEAA